jgi:hypothetical protein
LSQRKPIGRYGPAGTNDPTARFCDPLGFPLNFIYQNRAMSVATMPNRVVFLLQFGGFWREVWTDGRPLPTKVGGDDRDSLDPTYMGYSVGHWEDDYNFVIDTTGLDERTWLLRDGTPHSVMAHVQERWTRVDHNTMKVAMTIDDPRCLQSRFRWELFLPLGAEPEDQRVVVRPIGDAEVPAGAGRPGRQLSGRAAAASGRRRSWKVRDDNEDESSSVRSDDIAGSGRWELRSSRITGTRRMRDSRWR